MSKSSELQSETPHYDREEVIATITDFYQFLSKLPWVEPDDILYPPEGGWPNITKENFNFLGKNDEVITLLKQLPYVRMDGEDEYQVAPETFPCDYRRNYFKSPSFGKGNMPYEVPPTEKGFEFPPWVISLTNGKKHGDWLLLDTTDGTAIRYQLPGGWPPEYAEDDPRSWRNSCELPAEKLGDFLAKWKKNYEDLNWIGFPYAGFPNIWEEESCKSDFKDMQNLVRSFGWPANFRRDECKKALLEWEERVLERNQQQR